MSGESAGRPRVLVAGGGVAALEAVLALDELAGPRLAVSLLSPKSRFVYQPLSVAEPFGLGKAHRFELAELLRPREVRVVSDALAAVDAERREALTASGSRLPYEALLIAVGGRRREALPGAVTFSGSRAAAEVKRLLVEGARGRLRRLAFAVPAGVTWPLPAYELALMASAHFAAREAAVEEVVVTPEARPLEAFGERGSAAVEEMLGLRGIGFRSALPARVEEGRLEVAEGEPVPADAVVALPDLTAPEIDGLPADERGFVPVDRHGRVQGLPGVYAAGDATSFPLKQGGLAAQQADAAAEAIAADLGEDVRPQPFRPVLRGLLLTGPAPRSMRAELIRSRGRGEEGVRWPPAKIAGRRLGPCLARHGVPGSAPPGALALELEAPLEEGADAGGAEAAGS